MMPIEKSITITNDAYFVAAAVKDLTGKLAHFGFFPNPEAHETISAAMAELARLVWTHHQEVLSHASSAIDNLPNLLDDADASTQVSAKIRETNSDDPATQAAKKKFARYYEILACSGTGTSPPVPNSGSTD